MRRIPLVRSDSRRREELHRERVLAENSFRKVVMVEYPRKGIWSIGFVTAEDMRRGQRRRPACQHSCVYVPTTPNPTSGFIVMVPARRSWSWT